MNTLLDRHGIRSLPIEERIALFDELQEHLEEEAPETFYDPEFLAEIERRDREMDEHPELCISWEVVNQRLKETIRNVAANKLPPSGE